MGKRISVVTAIGTDVITEASQLPITDTGEHYDSSTVEGAFQEVGAQLSTVDTQLAQIATIKITEWESGNIHSSGVLQAFNYIIRSITPVRLPKGSTVTLPSYDYYYFGVLECDDNLQIVSKVPGIVNYDYVIPKTAYYRFTIVRFDKIDISQMIGEVSPLLTIYPPSYVALATKSDTKQYGEIQYDMESCVSSWWITPMAVTGGVRGKTYAGYSGLDGSSGVMSIDKNGSIVKKTLRPYFEPFDIDDHNSVAVYIMPSGRILAAYTKHRGHKRLYIRVSKQREDVREFYSNIVLNNPSDFYVSYTQIHYVNGKCWIFSRYSERYWGFIASTNVDDTTGAYSTGISTWTDAKMIFDGTTQYYCLFTKTTNTNVLRVVSYVREGDQSQKSIRQAFLDLSTGDIYNSDGVTNIGNINTLPTPILYTTLGVLVAGGTYYSRLLDTAVTAVNDTRVLYAIQTSSGIGNFDYCLYINGNTHYICNAGNEFGVETYVGGMIFDKNNPDIFYVDREENGVWYLEQWEYANSAVTKLKTLYTSTNKIARPFFAENGNKIFFSEGEFSDTNYVTNFTVYNYVDVSAE